MSEKTNLCDDCYRTECMLHPDNASELGNIRFRMIECGNRLSACIEIPDDEDYIGYEVHTEDDTTTIIERELPEPVEYNAFDHLNKLRDMVNDMIERDAEVKDALIELVSEIRKLPDWDTLGPLRQCIYKHRAVLANNDII